jgi:hypothetical protein
MNEVWHARSGVACQRDHGRRQVALSRVGESGPGGQDLVAGTWQRRQRAPRYITPGTARGSSGWDVTGSGAAVSAIPPAQIGHICAGYRWQRMRTITEQNGGSASDLPAFGWHSE